MSPRPYRLGRRQPSIERTRARIVSAAAALLGAGHVREFTIDAIARRAGVARMTVYYQFGSKTGMIEALLDRLAGGDLLDSLRTGFDDREPFDALAEYIGAFVGFWDGDRDVIRRLHGLARLDPEIDRGLQARAARRRAVLHAVVARLAGPGRQSAPAAIEETTDLLHALTSFDTVDVLAGPSRPPEAVATLLIRTAHAIVGMDGR